MTDHFEEIATAPDADSLRRAYALALAEHGARGDAAELRRQFVERRDDLDARRGVAGTPRDEVEAADRAFGRWALRVASGEESADHLRQELDELLPYLDERDRRRFSRVAAACDDWQAARDDDGVADVLLRSFLARLTGAAAGQAPAECAKSVGVVRRRYPRLYEVDPDWFESAATTSTTPVVAWLKRYWWWFVLLGIARVVFRIMDGLDGQTP